VCKPLIAWPKQPCKNGLVYGASLDGLLQSCNQLLFRCMHACNISTVCQFANFPTVGVNAGSARNLVRSNLYATEGWTSTNYLS
jgi:hypothetical protein